MGVSFCNGKENEQARITITSYEWFYFVRVLLPFHYNLSRIRGSQYIRRNGIFCYMRFFGVFGRGIPDPVFI